METLTLNRRNQLTLPKTVRDRLGVAAGHSFVADVVGRALILAPASPEALVFEPPPTRDGEEVLAALRATGQYSSEFLESFAQGVAESEYFNSRR